MFRSWADSFPAGVEVHPLELPGRASRFGEPPFDRMAPLVESVAECLSAYLDRPFAFFGHSVGALVAFELARRFRDRGLSPSCLFVAGCGAPQVPDPAPPLHGLPYRRFVEELRRLDGIPEAVLSCQELLELVIPTVRADYTVYETYDYVEADPLACPIVAFGGERDPTVDRTRLEAWRAQTTASFELRTFPGGHFFFDDEPTLVIADLADMLQRRLGEPGARE